MQLSRKQNLANDWHRSAQIYLTLIGHGLDGFSGIDKKQDNIQEGLTLRLINY